MEPSSELTAFITTTNRTCSECGEELGRGAWITLVENKGAQCLSCADLEHLTFLPSGDPALTRRARKYSILSSVVLKWSRARKRYERQGLLVEAQGLEQAEQECLADADAGQLLNCPPGLGISKLAISDFQVWPIIFAPSQRLP